MVREGVAVDRVTDRSIGLRAAGSPAMMSTTKTAPTMLTSNSTTTTTATTAATHVAASSGNDKYHHPNYNHDHYQIKTGKTYKT